MPGPGLRLQRGREVTWAQVASTVPSVKLYCKQLPVKPDLNRTASTFDMKAEVDMIIIFS